MRYMELNKGIKEILHKRGIVSPEDLEEFLSEKPQKTYDPFLLHNMEEGVDLILSAVDEGKRICIYGDYDTDGVTSVTLLLDVLKNIGAEVTYYIPSRFDEGYGLNENALTKIKEMGIDLVITVDCGCTSVREVKHAKSIGLEILITDHHTMKDEIPDCLIINPRHPECKYPFKYLAGVGVAFKLCQALVETLGLPKDIINRNLDMVGIGTVGDIVPLVDENRTLTKYGLRTIRITDRKGLKSLIENTGLVQNEVNSGRISFVIAPHINAAGRMKEATLAARLMQAVDNQKVDELTEKLIECNKERKSVQETLVKECEEIIKRDGLSSNKYMLLELAEAHEGVIGIVAGKIKEEYTVPTMVVTEIGDGLYKGTGRSPDGIDLFAMLNKKGDLFERFGGHAAACGFTISGENLPLLHAHLKEETDRLFQENSRLFDGRKEPEIILDSDMVSHEFVKELAYLEPFGKDNPVPVVGVKLNSIRYSRMGNEGQFIKVMGKLEDGRELQCVDFNKADETEKVAREAVAKNCSILAVGALEENIWNDRVQLRLKIDNLVLQ